MHGTRRLDDGRLNRSAATVRTMSIEELLDQAWSVDCAIRLGWSEGAARSAQRLAAGLTVHERESAQAWSAVEDRATAQAVAEARAARAGLRSLAAELRAGWGPRRADFYERVRTLVHREAAAVGDAAWCIVD